MKKFHYVHEDIAIEDMTYDQLQDVITDVINEREGYPEDSMSKYCLMLDDLYLDLTNAASLCDDNRDRLLTNEIIYSLQETAEGYRNGNLENFPRGCGCADAFHSVQQAMSYLGYSKHKIDAFKEYSEKEDTSHEEEDYCDGFYRGMSEAIDFLKIDRSKFEKFEMGEKETGRDDI